MELSRWRGYHPPGSGEERDPNGLGARRWFQSDLQQELDRLRSWVSQLMLRAQFVFLSVGW